MSGDERIAIFGASGAIGGALCAWFAGKGWDVVAVSRTLDPARAAEAGVVWVGWDPLSEEGGSVPPQLLEAKFTAAVWAQGRNVNDNIRSFRVEDHEDTYRANVVYIMKTLNELLANDMFRTPTRLCIISSIWQNIARQNKLSYTVSKAALQGLVQSLAIDLGMTGMLINAVLPGVLDTPMTRANLSPEQIRRFEEISPIGRLPALGDVSNLVGFLCSAANEGITGQFIAADAGFSYARII